jgi:hypothetical protein
MNTLARETIEAISKAATLILHPEEFPESARDSIISRLGNLSDACASTCYFLEKNYKATGDWDLYRDASITMLRVLEAEDERKPR